MWPDQIWRSYIRAMGAGAVAASGLITLLRTMPTIISALSAGLKDVRAEGNRESNSSSASGRIDYEVPMRWVIGGSIVIVAMISAVLMFFPIQRAQTQWYQNAFAALFLVV